MNNCFKCLNCFLTTTQSTKKVNELQSEHELKVIHQLSIQCICVQRSYEGFLFPLASDPLHGSVFNLLKCEIAEVKPSMHTFCLLKTATAFSLVI